MVTLKFMKKYGPLSMEAMGKNCGKQCQMKTCRKKSRKNIANNHLQLVLTLQIPLDVNQVKLRPQLLDYW